MLELLAQTTNLPDDASAKWYAGIVLIIAAGVAGIVLVMGIIFIFRMSRRWEDSIHRDIAERRAKRTPITDVWRESAHRYVDPDALSEQELADRRNAVEDPSDTFDSDDDSDEEVGEDEPPMDDGPAPGLPPEPGFGAGFDPPAEDDDPYGLFKDKPYVESEDTSEDDEDEDEDDNDELDDDFDPDNDEDDNPF